jgi:aminoglycoside phosphotransferase (APT) family kinase protein
MSAQDSGDAIRERLTRWLAGKLPGAKDLKISGFDLPSGMGWSVEILFFELQYSVAGSIQQRQCVLRRDVQDSPLILGTDLARQAAVMQHVAQHSTLPVPEVLGMEPASDILGAPFMVMERIGGKAVQQNPNYNVHGWVSELPEKRRAEPWLNGVKTLATLHQLQADESLVFLRQSERGAAGLPQYLEWVKEWSDWALQGREVAVINAALRHLFETMPTNVANVVLWGDPTPANCLFDENLNIAGLLDWELAGMGPAEIDLAWWLFMDQLMSEGLGYPRLAGLPNREALIQCYESEAGKAVDNIEYYEILSGLKMALVTLRSVDRTVASGKVDLAWDNNAIRSNPSISLLARKLGVSEPTDNSDFTIYIQSLFT